jgi:two-component system chemotaxis sensor kinase CheA
MSDSADRADNNRLLRERIDELATRVVVDGAEPDVSAELRWLSEHAGGSGYPEIARAAAELAETASGQFEPAEIDHLLRTGIARLQEILDREAREAPPQRAANALAQDPELAADFVAESREHLASIESRMLRLEQNPADRDAIHSVFRAFHTIKGLAGFLDFAVIHEVAHELETLLDLARNGTLAITPEVVDGVLDSVDYLEAAIDAVESSAAGNTPQPLADHRTLLSRIHALIAGNGAQAAPSPWDSAHEAPADRAHAEDAGETPVNESRNGNAKSRDTFWLRVDTAKLDYLMDMVGEMVIAQSLIRHNRSLASVQDSRLQADLAQLARTTNEVQRTAMAMRMIPMGQLFQRTARLVRDLSRKAGKRVEVETRGGDTELDKTIAEELGDPLLHMVRNAIDHGIEPPEARQAAGKNPTARLRLAAYHQGGQVVVEIADDGRGLDREKILKRARQNGLLSADAQLSDMEIYHLIFEPGFSTADQVTDLSGRGVGMDVVRKHVQKLRGRIEIQSTPGQGATFLLKLPLTLAIIEGLIVMVGSHRYIVPIFAVKEMLRPTPDLLSTVQGRGEMALVRGSLLPVVRLYRRFGVQPRSEHPCDGLLIVAESEDRQFCVLVDDLIGKQEVVIKSLGPALKNIPGIAGGAILGDGRVGLILDMNGIFEGARHE